MSLEPNQHLDFSLASGNYFMPARQWNWFLIHFFHTKEQNRRTKASKGVFDSIKSVVFCVPFGAHHIMNGYWCWLWDEHTHTHTRMNYVYSRADAHVERIQFSTYWFSCDHNLIFSRCRTFTQRARGKNHITTYEAIFRIDGKISIRVKNRLFFDDFFEEI